jgi:hypothetical protein
LLAVHTFLAMLAAGCLQYGQTGRYPGPIIMGPGPLAVHVRSVSADGAVVWERTLMAWPDAPVFLSDGKKHVLRLWAVPAGQNVLIYTEPGGPTEVAAGPNGEPALSAALDREFMLKGPAGIQFHVTVGRLYHVRPLIRGARTVPLERHFSS